MGDTLPNNRLLKYDVIRIIAIFFVLIVHVSGYFVFAFPDASTREFMIGNIFNGMARSCIPAFVMLSGALLLDEKRDFDTRTFYRKHLLPMVALLAGWLVFYGAYYAFALPMMKHQAVSVSAFWKYIFVLQGSKYPHLWYLYMIIGLYLIIPVLRLFVKKANVKYVIGIILAGLVVQYLGATAGIIKIGSSITAADFINNFVLDPVKGYYTFLLLGWLIANYEIRGAYRAIIYAAGAAACTAGIIGVQMLYPEIPDIRAYLYGANTLPQFFCGLALFVLISSIYGNRKTESRIIRQMSNFVFGIYVVHVFFLELFTQVIMPFRQGQSVLLYMAVMIAIVAALSYAAVLLFSKVKFFRKALHIKG